MRLTGEDSESRLRQNFFASRLVENQRVLAVFQRPNFENQERAELGCNHF